MIGLDRRSFCHGVVYGYVLAHVHDGEIVEAWKKFEVSTSAQDGINALVALRALLLSAPDRVLGCLDGLLEIKREAQA